jgi:TolA-binding protein
MEYRRLVQLDNTYPSIKNYKEGSTADVFVLNGLYKQNSVEFGLVPLDKVKWVANTNFRFILAIKNSDEDNNPLLYTSEEFYNDLKESYKEPNPYLSIGAFNPPFIITYTIKQLLKLFETLKPGEESDLVYITRNIYFNDKSEIDYEALVDYINWCVDTVNTLDFDSGGVKDAEFLGIWNTLELDPVTGKAVSKKEAETNRLTAANDAKLKLLQNELNKLIKEISEYETALKQNDYDNIGLSRSKVTVAGKEYTSDTHFLNRGKQNQDIKNQLTKYLNELKSKKTEIDKSIATASGAAPATTGGNITDLKQSDVNKIADIDKKISELKASIKTLSPFNTMWIKARIEITKLETERATIKASSKG